MPSSAKWNSSFLTHTQRLFTAPCFVALLMVVTTPALASNGFSVSGAPSFTLFGAFFPGWMFCALIGIIGAVVARAIMISSGLAKILPFQLFVCASIGLIFGLLVWLMWFGQ